MIVAAVAAWVAEAQEYPVTDFTSYTTREDALAGDRARSPYYRALEGAGEFHIPFAWADKQIFLHVERADAAVELMVNDRAVGRVESWSGPVSFDITALTDEGANTLALAGGHASGLYIAALPKVRVRDFEVVSTLSDNCRDGVLDFGVVVKSHQLNAKRVTVYFELFAPGGELLSATSKAVELRMRGEELVHFDALVPSVAAWSAERPALYTVVTRVQSEGRFTETIATRVGFRRVEVRGGQVLINGAPVEIRGVNLPDDLPAADEQAFAAALRQLKRHNIDAIRVPHPMPTRFYELCDMYGFYVCDQTNIGSHTGDADAANDPALLDTYLERTVGMYERTKNHPCVLFFSLGADAGNGYNLYRTYRWLKGREPMRPVLYDGAGRQWNTDLVFFPEGLPTDQITGPAEGDARPWVAARYTAPERFWAAIRGGAPVQGGFLSLDGPIGADGAPHPALVEAKAVCPRVIFEAVGQSGGEIRVINRFDFSDLNEYELTYVLTADGAEVSSGVLPLSLAPGAETTAAVPAPRRIVAGAEYAAELALRLKTPTGLLGAGDPVATGRVALSF